MPCYNLRALHDLIEGDLPETTSVWGAWVEMRVIYAKQRADPTYEYERPLPATANAAVGSVAAPMGDGQAADDIGDLAPVGLRKFKAA